LAVKDDHPRLIAFVLQDTAQQIRRVRCLFVEWLREWPLWFNWFWLRS
jgi:hypothetical protein